MFKIKNSEIQSIFLSSSNGRNGGNNTGIYKLMQSENVSVEKAYLLSILIPELEKLFSIIEENRKRISLIHFPEDKKTQKQVGLDNPKKVEAFMKDFQIVLDKEVEILSDKISFNISENELKDVGLSAADLLILKPILEIVR